MSLKERLRRSNVGPIIGLLVIAFLGVGCEGVVSFVFTPTPIVQPTPSRTRAVEPTVAIPTRLSPVVPTRIPSLFEITEQTCNLPNNRNPGWHDFLAFGPGVWAIDDNASMFVDQNMAAFVNSRDKRREKKNGVDDKDGVWIFSEPPGHSDLKMEVSRSGRWLEWILVYFTVDCQKKN